MDEKTLSHCTATSSPPPLRPDRSDSVEGPGVARARGDNASDISSPFFSRTFSDITLFELASSFLADKASTSPTHGSSRETSPAREGCPWDAKATTASATVRGATAADPPLDGLNRHLDLALDSLVEKAQSRAETKARRKYNKIKNGARVACETGSVAALPTTVTDANRSLLDGERAHPAEKTLFDIFEHSLDTRPPATRSCSRGELRAEEAAMAANKSVGTEKDRRLDTPLSHAHLLHTTTPVHAPPVRPPPEHLACFFVEISVEDVQRTSGTEEVMRRLLRQWCALESHGGTAAPEISVRDRCEPREQHERLDPDPPLVMFLAPTPNTLRQALLSWTLQPFAENAALTPLFGCCTIARDENTSTSPSGEKEGAAAEAYTTNMARAISSARGESRRVTFAEPIATHFGAAAASAVTAATRASTLDLAVDEVVNIFHIDATRSLGLVQSEEGRSALRRAGVPVAALFADAASAANYVATLRAQVASTKKTKKSKKRFRADHTSSPTTSRPTTVGTTASTNTGQVNARTVRDDSTKNNSVDEARARALWRLASWNLLARQLWHTPRRPALVLRRVSSSSSSASGSPSACSRQWLLGAVCAAISQTDTVALTTATRDLRARLSEAPALHITWSQRAILIAFATFLFGPGVVYTAVNVLRAYGEQVGCVGEGQGRAPTPQLSTMPSSRAAAAIRAHPTETSSYVKAFYCVCTGYQRYRVTATLRRYVHTSFDLHLTELWEGVSAAEGVEASVVDVYRIFFSSLASTVHQVVNEGPWRRVIPRLTCSCVPRSFERVRRTTNGTKLCRHMAELLFYTLQRQCILTASATATAHTAEEPAEKTMSDEAHTQKKRKKAKRGDAQSEAPAKTGPTSTSSTAMATDPTTTDVPRLDGLIAACAPPLHILTPFEPEEPHTSLSSPGEAPALVLTPFSTSHQSPPRGRQGKPRPTASRIATGDAFGDPHRGDANQGSSDESDATPPRQTKSRRGKRTRSSDEERGRSAEAMKQRRQPADHPHTTSAAASLAAQDGGRGRGVADADDSTFHQRALAYSLGVIRARAAELIQSQTTHLNATSAHTRRTPVSATASDNTASGAITHDVNAQMEASVLAPSSSQSSATAASVFSEVSALAWLQALLEVPHPSTPTSAPSSSPQQQMK